MATKRAIIWAAVSSEEQARGDKGSLAYQESLAREHAAKHELDIVDVITSDDSRSITLFEDACLNPRLGYGRLREHLDAADFDVLLYYDTTRLGRKASLGMTVMELCADAGVVLYDCANPPATLDAAPTESDRFVRAFHAVTSQGEIDKLRRRHMFGMINRVQRGELPSATCWGYAVTYNESGKPVVALNPEVAVWVRRVFDLYLSGHGARTIAATIAAENPPVAPAGGWQQSSVMGIVRRAWRYAGYAELNQRSPTNRPYIRARGTWEPVITDEEAERVAQERAYRKKNRHAADTPYLLAGICICATCGRLMYVSKQGSTVKGKKYTGYYLTCQRHKPYESASVRHVERFVRQMLQGLDAATIDAITAIDTDAAAQLAAQIERQQAIIAAAEQALERAADQYTDGVMDAANYRRQVERKQAQIADAQAELARLQHDANAEQQQANRRQRLTRASEIALAMMDDPDPAVANAYLRGLLRVTIHRNRVASGEWL